MAKKHKSPSFRYTIDLHGEDFAVWGVRTFNLGSEALRFAESLAKNNPEFAVIISVEPKFPKKNILRAS